MNATQKTGTWLAGVAIALWLLVAVLLVTTPDDAGANIGAGLAGLLAIALSVGAAVVLIVSTRTPATRGTAALSIAAWVVYLALAWNDTGSRATALTVLAIGVLSLAAAVVLTVRSGRAVGLSS